MNIVFVSKTHTSKDALVNKLMTAVSEFSDDAIVSSLGVIDRNQFDNEVIVDKKQITHYEINLNIRRINKRWNILRYPSLIIEYYLKVLLSLIKIKPVLIYTFNYSTLIPVVVYKFLRPSVKIVYHTRELESQQGHNQILNKIILIIERVAICFIKEIITPSDSISDWYKNKFKKDSVSTLLNAPNFVMKNSLSGDYYSNKFQFSKNEFVYIHAGYITEGRNIELLIKIFENHDLGKLILLGDISSPNFNYLMTSKFNNVFLHKDIPHELLGDYLKVADVGLCILDGQSVNDQLSLANKFMEYANAGLPIISSNFIEMDKMMRKYNLGMAIEPTEESIIETISKISKNKYSFYRNVPAELTWPYQKAKYLEIIKRVLPYEAIK